MRPISIAAAQSVSICGEVASNIDHHCRLAELAAAQGAEILVFPELSLTGYELAVAPALALSAEDKRLAPLVASAAANSITLVIGAPIRLASGLHIAALVLEPDGRQRIYTKRFLWGDENVAFVPGSLDPLLELRDDRAAFAICADTGHAEHAEAAAKRKASLYLAGVFFDPDSYESSSRRLASYASQHQMTVVMANAGGPATNFAAAGGSAIWSDSGELLARLDRAGAGIVVASRSAHGWRGEAHRL